MASIASAALEGRRNGRVLMLGLGGGTIAADIMMSEPIDWSLQVTCVEADADTAEADAPDAAPHSLSARGILSKQTACLQYPDEQ